MSATHTGLPADYEILRVLGSGANGLVYLARDGAGSLCALKEFAVAPVVAQRFFREAAMVFTLVHDHIVRCQNLLYGKSGRSFLVFEYVEGGTLRELLCKRETLPVPEALEMLRQLCLGLHHAHEARLIHCDLKPENILLQPGPGGFTYKLADLGIARYQAETEDSTGVPGSPAYMAPEQFYARPDTRTDLYALGVIFYEVLAGRRPFDGPPAALFLLHSQQEPDLGPLPDAGCAALARDLLAKQANARPASAADVLARVETLLAGSVETVVGAPAAGPPPEPEQWETAFEEPLRAERVVLNLELTAAQSLVPLFTRDTARVLVNDASSCDLVDLATARLRPRFLPEPCVGYADAGYGPVSIFATNRFVRSFDAGSCTSRTLFAHHQSRLVAFAHDREPGRARVFYASMQTLFCATPDGELLWRADCRNYTLPPQLLLAGSGEVYLSTGPVLPSVLAFGAGGRARPIPVEGPVLALRDEGGSGRFSAVLQGVAADAPARHVTYAAGAAQSHVELGVGIFHAAWHGGVLSLHFADGRIQLLSRTLALLWEYRGTGVALADCWHAVQRLWCLLEKEANGVWLRVFSLAPVRNAAADC